MLVARKPSPQFSQEGGYSGYIKRRMKKSFLSIYLCFLDGFVNTELQIEPDSLDDSHTFVSCSCSCKEEMITRVRRAEL